MSDNSDEDEYNLAVHEQQEPDLLSDTRDMFPTVPKEALGKVAVIRTSDRIAFRRCRRKWNWTYSGRYNLRPRAEPAPFWLGTGLHFAFEDYHGYRRFNSADDALDAYYRATSACGMDLPSDVDELLGLGQGMLRYYEDWLQNREELKTLVVDGEPQVEVHFFIELSKEDLERSGCKKEVLDLYDRILYSVTIDRVIEDTFKRLWLVEYKSAKVFQWHHLDTDPQVSAYAWAASLKYPGREIAGCVYQQHKKQIVAPPQFLSSTKMFSTSKRQKTTFALYSGALKNLYGPDRGKWPEPNRQFLDHLQVQESDIGDTLIKRDFVERNQHQINSEYYKLLLEVSEMLDPHLRLYPNPTRECAFDCGFNLACVHFDAGGDFQYEINSKMISRVGEETNWRKFLRYPNPDPSPTILSPVPSSVLESESQTKWY